MAFTDKELLAKMEPGVAGLPMQIAPEISIAISMKRIADFVCGDPDRMDIVAYIGSELRRDA